MAYRIYISRTDDPERASEDPITLDEWKAVVRDVPEMHLYEGVDALPGHVEAPDPSEGLARWAGHPRFDSVWLNHDKGTVYAEGFDPYVSMRMRAIANRLGAKVIDDQGRQY